MEFQETYEITMGAKRLYFRTRGGPSQGWGNIFRLTSFADYCRDRLSCDIHFFVEGPSEVIDYLRNKNFKITQLAEGVALQDEAKEFSRHPKADVLFMEMLDCGYDRQRILKKFTDKLVVYDDLLDHRYCADIVVCGQLLPDYGNAKISDQNTKFLLGLDYFLMRPEFQLYLGRKREYAEDIRDILVTLGGGQYDIGYIKIASALASLKWNAVKTFILGYAARGKLKSEILKILPEARILDGIDEMANHFWKADIAIVSGGYSKFEAAMTGTPMVIVSTQWHQIPLAEGFGRKTGAPYVGYMSFITQEKIRSSIEALRDLSERREHGARIRAAIDGGGMDRVYSEIFGNRNETCIKVSASLE